MKANTIKLLVPSFGFYLLLGLLTGVIFLWDIWADISQHLFQLVMGFFVGLGLGLAVLFFEKRIYIHRSQQKITTQYKTTSLPLSIYLLLLLVPAVRSTSEIAHIFAFASVVYLLTLAVILFRIRKSKDSMNS